MESSGLVAHLGCEAFGARAMSEVSVYCIRMSDQRIYFLAEEFRMHERYCHV